VRRGDVPGRDATMSGSASTQPIIETAGLRRTYRGRGGAVEAVAGVDLRVGAGDIFGFLGPNGAGKTTTLRILATLLPPTAGTARVAGFDVARQAREVRTRIGYVAKAGGSYREATGREELVIQGRLFGMGKAEAAVRAAEILDALGLTDAADRTCATYSGGMRRRLNIGIGMVHRPALLFLDEPTTGLDPQARARLWEEIRKLRETGATVFLKNQKTKSIRSYSTTEKGHYYFAQVNMTDDFDLWAEKDGKKSAVKTVSSWDDRKDFILDLKIK